MILETEDERKAFEFICNIASDEFSRRGCNDLSTEDEKRFGHLLVQREDVDQTIFLDAVKFDFDILEWLKIQIKK